MKFFLLILLLAPLKSESYYVAIYGNNNTNDGKSISYPFRTVAHAATVMSAGDTCFIRGGTYHEIVNITDNDGMDGMPLVFTRYNNERVIFDGTVSIDSNWVQHAGNIWKTTIDFDIWQLFVDREEQVMARWPNASFSDSSVFDTENHWAHGTMKQSTPNIYGNGTLIHQVKTNDQGELIDLSAQNFDLDETNKEAIGILNVGSFRTWSRKINSHTGNTFTYDPVPQNEWKTKEHQYFLEGRLEFLDKEGEWFLDTAPTKNVLYYWAPSGQDPNKLNIRGKVQSYAFVVSKSDHVELRNLEFFGTAFYFYKSNRSKVDQCNFYYPSSSKRMLRASGQEPDVSKIKSSSYTSVTNSAFRFTDGSAIETSGGNNVIKNNYFYHIDYTSSDLTGLMVSVLMSGKNNKFQNNTMHRLGASATVVGGDSALFEYNNIYDTGHVQSDGAMIQCMTGAQPGTVIRYNWLHDSKKYGARFDGNGAGNNGLMHHNVMWNLGNSGIMAKGYEHKIFNNTVINGPGNKNDILIMIGQGGNAGSITRNNVANRISGHRSGSYQNYPVPGTYDHNENGYESGRDVSTLFIDVANLDFRPNPDSVLVDAGTVITGITDSYSGSAPDIGAYEYGGDMWSAGIDWNVDTKFGSAWIDYVNPAPQIDSIVVANNNTSLQVYFNESVFNSIENQSNLEASDFALSISGGTATLASATPTAITQNGNTYTLSFNLSGTPDGSEVISVAPLANSIFDATGNQAATSQSNGSGTLNDQTKPTVDSVSLAADNSTIVVVFTEPVYSTANGTGNLEASDFALSISGGTATLASATPTAITQNGNAYTLSFNLSGTPDGSEVISVAPLANSIFDATGNQAATSQSNGSGTLNEKIRPTISITATNGSGQLDNGSATNDTVITVSFNISEPTSNFIIDDISISQGTISNFTSTSNISYQAKIRPLSNNFILIDVAENSFTDTASNGNITAQQFKWKYDGVSPTVDSVSLAADNSTIVVVFTEPVYSTANGTGNLEASDFALSISGGTATLASATPTAITQNGNAYTLSFNLSGTPDGSEVISVAPLANSIFDATGNQAATSQSNGSGTLNDQTKPTVSAITFAADNSYIDVSFSVDVYANSNGSGALEMNDFTLSFAQNQGTATAAQIIGIKKTDSPLISSASALQGGESVVRLFISFNGTPNGLEAITIAPKDGSSIFDAAGNGAIVNQTKNSASFKDQVLPVVTINPANSSTNILRNANIIISFSEKIRNIDNSEINDVNVDSLIVLNRQNNPENSLAFDASIDTDKKVITVDPLVDFDYSETIYLSIGGFEDFGGNILTSNPSTMFNVIANVKPVAIAQDVTLNEDSKMSIELKGTDSENAPLSYVFSLPGFGELAGDAPNLVYSPMADFFGPDSFRFVVNDGFDNSDSSFIKINVQPINDSPKLQLANLDTLKINQVSNEGYLFPKNNNQNSIDILSISDVDNDKIAKTIIKIQPFISGEDTLFIENSNIYPDIKSDGSGKVFTFTTPDLIGANHAYSLSLIKYKNLLGKDLTKGIRTILGFVSDGDSLSNSLSRIINLNIVNSIPEALSESYHTLEDSAITLSLKASDKDSDLLTFNIIQDPLNGKLRGELPDVMYIPNDNFYGKDSIKYNVNDGIQNSKTALVFIHVKSLNDPPTNLSFQSPDDESEIVITINNLEGSQANFKWHQSTDPDDDKLQYLFNSWYEIIDQNGKLNTESIDSVLYNTEYSIPYKRFLGYLDKHRSPRGKFIWNVNVTDGKDTTYSNIRFTLNIEGKYIALSVQDDIIPKSYSLKQNYPNPFNPITRIQFDIPSRSKVSINIYDILGSKVTTIINQDIEPGRHVITWNAVDNNNRKLPSGLYFYQIHADSFIATKKMILVK